MLQCRTADVDCLTKAEKELRINKSAHHGLTAPTLANHQRTVIKNTLRYFS
jgi:hypothetical protein